MSTTSSEEARWELEDRPEGIRVLTLHNPAKRNALDAALLESLARALDLDATRHVRAWVLRGAGTQAFCAGYDLATLDAGNAERLPDARLGEVLGMLERHPAPSIALVMGPAFGAGCELAATCDFRVGGPQALFCMPPVRLGIVYAPEGIRRFIGLIGLARAKRMFFTAQRVDARTAEAWGLLDATVTEDNAEDTALTLALELTRAAPLALQGTRRVFQALTDERLTEETWAVLHRLRAEAFASEDAAEGRAAFREKRLPQFHGK